MKVTDRPRRSSRLLLLTSSRSQDGWPHCAHSNHRSCLEFILPSVNYHKPSFSFSISVRQEKGRWRSSELLGPLMTTMEGKPILCPLSALLSSLSRACLLFGRDGCPGFALGLAFFVNWLIGIFFSACCSDPVWRLREPIIAWSLRTLGCPLATTSSLGSTLR